ncbi:MAG: DUF3048 domain-containing protein [Ilumatobacteraceae bacterium]
MTATRREVLSMAAALGIVAAACSDDPAADTATTVEQTVAIEPPPATVAVSTTVAASTTTTEPATTTTTAGVDPVFPLTGLPVPFGLDPGRPAMVVKLDNHPIARPQSGLNEADIVFEENVEQLTRFAAVFHSNGTDPVGPIRSGRTQDVDLLGSFNNPLFVWSGGNRRVADAIGASGFFQIDQNVGRGIMFRSERPGPHDLYADMTKLYLLTPFGSGPPQQQFSYRAEGDDAAGDPASGVKLSMDGVQALWQWDPTTATYGRSSDGKIHQDTVLDAQFSTNNVLVVVVDYVPSPADGRSPEAQTLGAGELQVFSAGKHISGTWTRPDRRSPFVLADPTGIPIPLTPGRTMIELARAFKWVGIPDGIDPATVAYP